MKKALILTLVAAPLAAIPTIALAGSPVDNFGVQAIQASDYALAEARLQARLAVAPSDPPALLNLGYVYRHTARPREANAAYARVLQRSNVALTAMDGRVVRSHDLARAGLGGEVLLATR